MRNNCKDIERGFLEGVASADNMKAYQDLNFKTVIEQVEDYVERKLPETEKKMRKKTQGKKTIGFVERMSKKFGNRNEPISEKEMENIYKRTFGFKDPKTKKLMGPLAEKLWLTTKIGAVLNNKPHIAEAFYYEADKIAKRYIPKMPDNDSYTLGVTDILQIPIPHIAKFPLGAVKEMSWALNDFFYEMGKKDDIKFHKGYLGNLEMEFTLTRKAARKTSNPYFIKFMRNVIQKPSVEQALNRKFMVPADLKDASGKSMFLPNVRDVYRPEDAKNIPYAKKGKSIKYSRKSHGVNTIYNQVIPISFRTHFADTLADKSELMGMLHLYQQGRLYIRDDNTVWLRDQKVKTDRTYEDSGEPVYEWRGSTPYVMNDKNQNVNFTSEMNTRKIYDKKRKSDVWVIGKGNKHLKISNKVPKKFKFSGESQLSEFHEIVNGMQSIFRAFGLRVQSQMEEQDEKLRDVMKNARIRLDKKQNAQLDEMFKVIFEDDMLAIHGVNKFELKNTDYFPTKYTYAMLVKGLGDATIQLETKIAKNSENLQSKTIKADPEKYTKLRQSIIENKNTLHYIEEMQKMLADEDQPTDGGVSKNPIFAQNYLRHFRSVSNMIDIKNSRLDELVFQDYIDETAKQLNRRDIAIDLIDAYARSYGQPRLQDYMLNMFKMTFQFPDAKGSILGYVHTDEGMRKVFQSGIFKKIKGGKFDVNDLARNVSQFNAGNLLSGPADGLVNLLSSVQDVVESGAESFFDAFSDYERNTEYWENIAENKGGVITFQKYIENFVDRTLRVHEIEQGRALQQDLKDKIKRMTKDIDKLDPKELNQKWKKTWKRINRDLKILDNTIPSRTQHVVQLIAKYAITHKIERSQYEKDPREIPLFNIKVDAVKDALGFYQRVPSIALTEKQLRTVSFIIGYKNGQKYLKGLNPTEDDIINYAREYVFQAQFALETNMAGRKGGTALSKLWYNISFFSTQQTGWHNDIHKAWFAQYRDNTHLFIEKQKQKALSGANIDKFVKAPARAYYNLFKNMMSMVPGTVNAKKKKAMQKEILPFIGRGEGVFLSFGLASATTSLVLFSNPAIYGLYSAFRRMLFMNNSWRAIAGMNAKQYSVPIGIASMSAFAIRYLLSGDPEDEEDFLLELQKNTRHVTGVGGSTAVTGVLKTGDFLNNTIRRGEPMSDKLEFTFEKGPYGGTASTILGGTFGTGTYIYDELIEPEIRSRPMPEFIRDSVEY
jgi:hypothetical protein